MKIQPESKTGTLLKSQIDEAVTDVYPKAYGIDINFYRDNFDVIFRIDLEDEFNSVEFYRYNEEQFKKLIVKYLEKKDVKVKMNKEFDYSTAHIYFEQNVLKFRHI